MHSQAVSLLPLQELFILHALLLHQQRTAYFTGFLGNLTSLFQLYRLSTE
jgi:hypothetical protein